jgi:hypothetical protein
VVSRSGSGADNQSRSDKNSATKPAQKHVSLLH